MKFSELPIDVQERLSKEMTELSKKNTNTAYRILLYNADGTRYFEADRICMPWQDDKGNYMPFGGGTYWKLRYGKVSFRRKIDTFIGYDEYVLSNGKTFGKSANGTIIPATLKTKKEVMAVAKAIGIFEI